MNINKQVKQVKGLSKEKQTQRERGLGGGEAKEGIGTTWAVSTRHSIQ